MGIRFKCHHCEHELHVKDFQAGKRGRCPDCQGKFRIPLADAEHSLDSESEMSSLSDVEVDSTASDSVIAAGANSLPQRSSARAPTQSAPAARPVAGIQPSAAAGSSAQAGPAQSPELLQPASKLSKPAPSVPQAISEAPQARWFVRPSSGGQYGPAGGDMMLQWLNENRVGDDALVWCEGWPEWLPATDVFADYFELPRVPQFNSLAPDAAFSRTSATTKRQDKPAELQDGTAEPQDNSAEPQDGTATSLGERNRHDRKHKRRRNYTFMIAVLSVVMLLLLVALVTVLVRQE